MAKINEKMVGEVTNYSTEHGAYAVLAKFTNRMDSSVFSRWLEADLEAEGLLECSLPSGATSCDWTPTRDDRPVECSILVGDTYVVCPRVSIYRFWMDWELLGSRRPEVAIAAFSHLAQNCFAAIDIVYDDNLWWFHRAFEPWERFLDLARIAQCFDDMNGDVYHLLESVGFDCRRVDTLFRKPVLMDVLEQQAQRDDKPFSQWEVLEVLIDAVVSEEKAGSISRQLAESVFWLFDKCPISLYESINDELDVNARLEFFARLWCSIPNEVLDESPSDFAQFVETYKLGEQSWASILSDVVSDLPRNTGAFTIVALREKYNEFLQTRWTGYTHMRYAREIAIRPGTSKDGI